MKYRRIRLSNPKIESMLLVANGAFEALFSMGFEEDTDALFLPFSASLETIKAFKLAIEALTPPQSTERKSANPLSETDRVSEPAATRDIICSGDVCMDIGKEKPLMGFEKHEFMKCMRKHNNK